MKRISKRFVPFVFSLLLAVSAPGMSHAGDSDCSGKFDRAMPSTEKIERALKCFEVEGLSLGLKEEDLIKVLTRSGYKLGRKIVRGRENKRTFYQYQRGRGKKFSKVKLSKRHRGDHVSEMTISLPNPGGDAYLNEEKARFLKIFGHSESACRKEKRFTRCRLQGLTKTNELLIEVKFSAKRLIYTIRNQPSLKAKSLAGQGYDTGPSGKVRTTMKTASKFKISKRVEMITATLLSTTKDLPPGHPCLEYDTNNAKLVRPCLEKLIKARRERMALIESLTPQEIHEFRILMRQRFKGPLGFRSPWDFSYKNHFIIKKQSQCGMMRRRYAKNLELVGYVGVEADRRVPSCAVFAELHKVYAKQPVVWAGCTGIPEPQNPQYVRDCLELIVKLKWYRSRLNGDPLSSSNDIFWDCKRLRKTYLGNLSEADPDFKHGTVAVTPDCKVLETAYASLKKKTKDERDKQRHAAEKQRNDFLHKVYYEKTPEREKSKFSDAERRIMKNGRLAVPASYPPPTAEEIRLGVIRRYFDDNDKAGYEPVITDGKTLYIASLMPGFLMFSDGPLGLEIRYDEPINIRCSKAQPGYMCQYRLPRTSRFDQLTETHLRDLNSRFPGSRMGIDLVLKAISVESRTHQNDWFVLTETGWKQQLTEKQIAARYRLKEENRKREEAWRQQMQRNADNDRALGRAYFGR